MKLRQHRQLRATDLEVKIVHLEGVKTAKVYDLIDKAQLQNLIDDYQSRYKALTGHHFHYHTRSSE
jgi:hypothetical protein